MAGRGDKTPNKNGPKAPLPLPPTPQLKMKKIPQAPPLQNKIFLVPPFAFFLYFSRSPLVRGGEGGVPVMLSYNRFYFVSICYEKNCGHSLDTHPKTYIGSFSWQLEHGCCSLINISILGELIVKCGISQFIRRTAFPVLKRESNESTLTIYRGLFRQTSKTELFLRIVHGFQLLTILSKSLLRLRHDTHMTSMKIAKFSRPPTPLVYLCPEFFHPLNLGRPISNEPPPSSNDNQTIKRKHSPRINIIYYQVLPSGRLSFSVSTH